VTVTDTAALGRVGTVRRGSPLMRAYTAAWMQTTRPVTVLAGATRSTRLGRSATGMVWLATDTLLHRRVTVKVVHSARRRPGLRRRPDRGGATSGRARDPGLARLLDPAGSGRHLRCARARRGPSLRTRLNEAGPLPAEAVGIIVVVLQGLGAAHEAGARHLALDPDDVIVSNSGQIRLTDLGIGAAIANAKPAEAVELLGANRLAPSGRRRTRRRADRHLPGRRPSVRAADGGAAARAHVRPRGAQGRPSRGRPSHRASPQHRPRQEVPRHALLPERAHSRRRPRRPLRASGHPEGGSGSRVLGRHPR
jgi:serine/threonine protein kinase